MKALKKLAVFCVGAALTVGSAFGFAACDNGTDPESDSDIREVYSLYVASAEESGNEPMTYEEWLASIKGKDGAPGKDGTPGKNGENGKDGSSFLHGEGAPDAADGKAGDLYLDVLTGDLYEKDANGWSTEPVGNLKGPQGEQGEQGPQGPRGPKGGETVVKEYKGVEIASTSTHEFDITGVPGGIYWLVATNVQGIDVARETLIATYVFNSSLYDHTYDMYSEATEGYRGIVRVGGTNSTKKPNCLKVENKGSETVTADFKLVMYEPEDIVVRDGLEVEVPFNAYTGRKAGIYETVYVSLDPSLIGKNVKITFSSDYPYSANDGKPRVYPYSPDPYSISVGVSFEVAENYKEGIWSATWTIPENINAYGKTPEGGRDSESGKKDFPTTGLFFDMAYAKSAYRAFNAVVKFEVVEAE